MTTLRLSKHHGLGNDFLVLLDQGGDARLAERLCDRRTGIGADGLLLGTTGGPDHADLTMVLHNADGSRAEMSGNGIRCLAQAWVRHAGAAGRPLRIATDAGLRTVEVEPTGDPAVVVAHVDMGKALPGPDPAGAVPAGIERSATVDIGNPHLVLLVDDIDRPDVDTEGPAIEARFAEGINVEWIVAASGADRLDLRVWERGAGHTLACGTGACAAAHAAHQWGLVGERVTVVMEGGEVEVALGDPITLIGPATHVADLEIEKR